MCKLINTNESLGGMDTLICLLKAVGPGHAQDSSVWRGTSFLNEEIRHVATAPRCRRPHSRLFLNSIFFTQPYSSEY